MSQEAARVRVSCLTIQRQTGGVSVHSEMYCARFGDFTSSTTK